ncbi:MAG: phosphomannomutase/phosphoglucomutase [bacterium]
MVNPNIFREYDIRGIADVDLVDSTAMLIGKALATHLKREDKKTIVVGRDVRLSSERLRNAIVSGITSTGMDAIDVGVVPTPANYFAILHYEADGGIMITGSHNPIEYNGFKMSKNIGSIAAIFAEEIQQLKRLIENEDFETGEGSVEVRDVIPGYMAALKERIQIDKKLKIVIDAGNGTGGEIGPDLFEALGCEVVRLYCEPDGTFPNHLPDPTVPKYVKDLIAEVHEHNADVGIGLDGDSDRVGVIDNKGRMVFADTLLAIFARDTLSRHPGTQIVFDVKCSQALPEVIKDSGGKPFMWKTGHSILKSKMKELHSPLDIFIADGYLGYDDGIFSAGRLLQILARSGKTLAEIHDSIPAFESTPEIRVECTDEDKFNVVAELVALFKTEYEVIDVDGARVLFGDGWGLVRASNTQPVLVLRFEAKSEERLREIVAIFKKALDEYPCVKYSDDDFYGY